MRNKTIEEVRRAASEGAGVCALVAVAKTAMGTESTTFGIMSLLIDALGVSLADIRELPGARCLGGQVYSDEEIEKLISPAIQKALISRP